MTDIDPATSLSGYLTTARNAIAELREAALAEISRARAARAAQYDRGYANGYAEGARDSLAHVVEQALAAIASGEPVPEIHGTVTTEEAAGFPDPSGIAEAIAEALTQHACAPDAAPVAAEQLPVAEAAPVVDQAPADPSPESEAALAAPEAAPPVAEPPAEGYIGLTNGEAAGSAVTAGSSQPAGYKPFWQGENHDRLRALIAGFPTEAELLAAFPGRALPAIAAQCYAIKIPVPTKANLADWVKHRATRAPAGLADEETDEPSPPAADRAKPLPIRVTVDDVINTLRRAGDSVICQDAPDFKEFRVNGSKMDRAEILKKANRYRTRNGLAAWTDDQVAWFRPMPSAPVKVGPAFSGKPTGRRP